MPAGDTQKGAGERVILGLSGSSALPVGLRMLEFFLGRAEAELHTVFTEGAIQVAHHEFDLELTDRGDLLEHLEVEEVRCDWSDYDYEELGAPIASGSFGVERMVVAPCSMGTLAAIAGGHSDNLLERAADVVLKERGNLVTVPREAPLSRIHLKNMLALVEAGGTVLPPVLTFYHGPDSAEAMVDFTVGKVLDILGIEHTLYRRWGSTE